MFGLLPDKREFNNFIARIAGKCFSTSKMPLSNIYNVHFKKEILNKTQTGSIRNFGKFSIVVGHILNI